MPFVPASEISRTYDVVVIGSGFGSLFFTHKMLALDPRLRVLMIEWGVVKPYEEQVAQGRNSDIPHRSTYATPDDKVWNFTIGFGGGTNCWFAQTPRMLPNDFGTKTLYNVGQDWPITYADLEPYYCDAEEIMQISGPDDLATLFPRSRPYPQPPHRLSTPCEIMKRAQPGYHFAMPAARARVPTETRNACCATGTCNFCPVNAKFTVHNGFQKLVAHPSLSIVTGARVTSLDIENDVARRARFEANGREHEVGGTLFVMGANAIHSPPILQRSGLETPLTGVGLNEQIATRVEVLLDGVDNFDGGSLTSGINYSLADGAFRREHAGAMILFGNRWGGFGLRREYGRWRQTLPLRIAVEDPPSDSCRVTAGREGIPDVHYPHPTDYAIRGIDAARSKLEKVLAPLPVEAIKLYYDLEPTESHLQSTLRMGRTPQDSVVDSGQIHHKVRNLVVVGSSVFATCPTANPSLTVAALSLRAADRIIGHASG